MSDPSDLLRYARENAGSVLREYERDPLSVPVSAVALANVVAQMPDYPADLRSKCEALAEEMDDWAENARRYATVAGLDERMKCRARELAYERAADRIRRAGQS